MEQNVLFGTRSIDLRGRMQNSWRDDWRVDEWLGKHWICCGRNVLLHGNPWRLRFDGPSLRFWRRKKLVCRAHSCFFWGGVGEVVWVFTSRPFLKNGRRYCFGVRRHIAISAVSADVLPYIPVAIKASLFKLDMYNICKNNIAKMFLDFLEF